MTIQIGDIYRYNAKEYACIDCTADIFDPLQHGFQPSSICTACWRGYWCEFEIKDKGIMLQTLHIHDDNEYYPAINGVSISSWEYMPALTHTNEGLIPTEIPRYFGHETYENLELSLHFTGKMLLGIDFANHAFFNHPSDCKELISLVFENGELEKIDDYSELAKILRKVKKRFKLREYRQDKEIYEKLPESLRQSLWWRRETTARTSRERKKLADFKK